MFALAASADEEVTSFLTIDEVPDGTLYLPQFPDTASVYFVYDWLHYCEGKQLRSTERGEQAIKDADKSLSAMLEGFNAFLDIEITEEDTPLTFAFLDKVKTGVNWSCKKAKNYFVRKRPFVQFNESTLIPEDEAEDSTPRSYPSGHSACGWGLALMLAELFPDNQEAILKWGYEFGQSRVIAGYHYQTDVDAARLAASASFARLHASEEFAEALKEVKEELKEKMATKTDDASGARAAKTAYYDTSGIQLPGKRSGVTLVREMSEDGTVETKKVLSR